MTKKNHFYAIIRPYRKDFITRPNEDEEKIMIDHFNYLKSLMDQKKLFLAGPTLIAEDPFGLVIFETKNAAEAKKLLENDPSIKTGIQKIADFRPIRLSLIRK
ncbi:MAG: YciI family protein [Promethearchaeota archaeon]|jgi:uncharacterized protein YciI